MAVEKLTYDQVLAAARRLRAAERRQLVAALAEPARAAARRLRESYRMGDQRRERLSELLQKGNAGKLTAAERAEADRLVEEFEQRTLELAQALVGAPARGRKANGRALD